MTKIEEEKLEKNKEEIDKTDDFEQVNKVKESVK